MEKGDAGLGALIMYSEPSINLTDRVIKAFAGKGARRAPDPPPRSQPQSYTPPSPPANTPAPRGAWRPWVHCGGTHESYSLVHDERVLAHPLRIRAAVLPRTVPPHPPVPDP